MHTLIRSPRRQACVIYTGIAESDGLGTARGWRERYANGRQGHNNEVAV